MDTMRIVFTVDRHALSALRDQLQRDTFVPYDDGYDAARSIWHGAIDRKPAVVARCAGPGTARSRAGRQHTGIA